MAKCYPKEIFNSIRSYKEGDTKTFSIEALFSRGNKVSPLIPPAYSRLKLSIFEKNGGVNGNIRESEIEAIYIASKACVDKYLCAPAEVEETQVPFITGRNKGKTPAQVLEETGNLDILRSEKQFLKQNVDRFPKNKEIIDSIDRAAIAFKNGKPIKSKGALNIYHSDSRSVGKIDENGMKRIYGIDITFFKGKFNVTINNCKAPVDTEENGSLRVRMRESIEQKSLNFEMDWAEWIAAISKCNRAADSYDKCTFSYAWKEAEKLESKNAYIAQR